MRTVCLIVTLAVLLLSTPIFAMQEIPIKVVNGIIQPETLIPKDTIKVVCDGSKYIIYESGDVLPVTPLPLQLKGEFLGKKIYHARDVKQAVAEEIATMFAASTNSGDKVADQLKLVCDILALLCAKGGWVTYAQAGIQGITSEAEAVTYINNNLVPLLNQRNNLRQQARQFIQDKGL